MKPTHVFCTTVVLAVLMSGQANAATVFLSDKGIDTGPDIGVNPTLTLNVGETKQLHLWVQAQAEAGHMYGLAADIPNEDTGIAYATAVNVFNPEVGGNARWEPDYDPGTLDELLQDMALVAITTSGLDATDPLVLAGNDPYYDVATSSFLVATMDVEGLAVGQTDVYMTIDSVTTGEDPVIIHLGWGDDPVSCPAGGCCGPSALPDATIIVVPEPAAITLLALTALGFIRRRCRQVSSL